MVRLKTELSRDPGTADFDAGLQSLLTRLDPEEVGRAADPAE